MIYLSGVLVVILALIYDVLYNKKELHKPNNIWLIILAVLVVVVLSWFTVVWYVLNKSVQCLRDKE